MKYLLRILPITQYESNKSLYAMMKQAAAIGIPMCLPLEFGTCESGVYLIQSWVNGSELGDIMQKSSDSEQYARGFQAGLILNKIHTMPNPAPLVDFWTKEPIT